MLSLDYYDCQSKLFILQPADYSKGFSAALISVIVLLKISKKTIELRLHFLVRPSGG